MIQIIDFSFFIVALAILGFVIKDVFNSYRKSTTPYDIKRDSEKMFSYISLALLSISFLWLFFILFLFPSFGDIIFNENTNPIFKSIEFLHDSGIMTDTEYSDLSDQITVSIFYLTFFSLFYVGAYTFIGLIGSISNYFDTKAVCVVFQANNSEEQKFRRIIYESNDFIYFEDFDNFKKWHAIKKDGITKIESKYSDSKVDNKISPFLKQWIQNNKYIQRSEVRLGGALVSLCFYGILVSISRTYEIGSLVLIGLIFALIAFILLMLERYSK